MALSMRPSSMYNKAISTIAYGTKYSSSLISLCRLRTPSRHLKIHQIEAKILISNAEFQLNLYLNQSDLNCDSIEKRNSRETERLREREKELTEETEVDFSFDANRPLSIIELAHDFPHHIYYVRFVHLMLAELFQ